MQPHFLQYVQWSSYVWLLAFHFRNGELPRHLLNTMISCECIALCRDGNRDWMHAWGINWRRNVGGSISVVLSSESDGSSKGRSSVLGGCVILPMRRTLCSLFHLLCIDFYHRLYNQEIQCCCDLVIRWYWKFYLLYQSPFWNQQIGKEFRVLVHWSQWRISSKGVWIHVRNIVNFILCFDWPYSKSMDTLSVIRAIFPKKVIWSSKHMFNSIQRYPCLETFSCELIC